MKVTAGICVYNDAKYIRMCLDSVVNQSFGLENIEIICVDDGSIDETPDIISEYQRKYKNIKYFRHENTGSPSTSRNRIIDNASGEYIYFIDGDDYLGLEAIERMYYQGKKHNADIIIGKFKGVNRGVPVLLFKTNQEKTNFFESKVVDSMNALKMFRTSYIRSINAKFNPNIKHAEDHPFTMKAYLHTNSISIISDYDCYYCTRYTDGNRTQLTRQLISVEEYYKYYFETLDVIKDSKLEPELKTKAFIKYWHRLLYLDIPIEFRRKRPEYDRKLSFAFLHKIAHEYTNPDIIKGLKNKEHLALKLILNGNYDLFDEYMRLHVIA